MAADESVPLLRQKALDHQLLGPRSVPVAAIDASIGLQLFFWLLIVLMATFLLASTEYKETVSARGVLEPNRGVQRINSPTTARVERIYVRLGDSVSEGDVLALLTTEAYDRQGASLQRRRTTALRNEQHLLQEQLQNEQLAREESARSSEQTANNIRVRQVGMEREEALLARQIELSERNLRAVTALYEAGTSSVREFDQQRSAHLELLARAQLLSQRTLQSEHDLIAVSSVQRAAQLDFDKSILRLRREIEAVEREIANLAQQTHFAVVAEGAGVVAELGLETGKPVRANQPLFYINPESSELEATIYVPSAVQGRLIPGQAVLLRLDAFDYRQYGRQEATILSIGQAPIDPRDTLLPVAGIAEPVFRITAQLQNQNPYRDIEYSLRRGTALTADFVVAEMSLIRFIFNPILKLRGKVA